MTELNKPNLGNQDAPSNSVKSSSSGKSASNTAPLETRSLMPRVT